MRCLHAAPVLRFASKLDRKTVTRLWMRNLTINGMEELMGVTHGKDSIGLTDGQLVISVLEHEQYRSRIYFSIAFRYVRLLPREAFSRILHVVV